MKDFKKPNIFICGSSGSGKSTSLERLDPMRTIILNTEQKQLPFRGAGRFSKQKFIKNLEEFKHYFERALGSDADVIVIESFTSLCEMIRVSARTKHSGWDAWNSQNIKGQFTGYNDEIGMILRQSKGTNKYVIFTGIDDELSEGRVYERWIKVDGNEWKRKVEKEFVIVLYTDMTDRKADKTVNYRLLTNSDGICSAKSPKEMLPMFIPNDVLEVIEASEKYYDIEVLEEESA
jgi:AAA domain